MSHDSKLQQAVLAELEWEPSVNPAHIGVTANAGVVTLTGHVDDYMQKHAAETAAGEADAESASSGLSTGLGRGTGLLAASAIRGPDNVDQVSSRGMMTGALAAAAASGPRPVRTARGDVAGLSGREPITPRTRPTQASVRITIPATHTSALGGVRILGPSPTGGGNWTSESLELDIGSSPGPEAAADNITHRRRQSSRHESRARGRSRRRDPRIAQLSATHLARVVAQRLVDELDAARPLIADQPLGQMTMQLFDAQARPGLHDRVDPCA